MMQSLPKRPYPQIHLPALQPDEAMLVVHIFERAIRAIWRAHGQAMADFLRGDTVHNDASVDRDPNAV